MPVDAVEARRAGERSGRRPVVEASGADFVRRPAAPDPGAYDARGQRASGNPLAIPVPAPLPKATLADPMAPHTMWERLRIQREQLLKPFTR
jgi:hypothetical protein